MKEKIAIISNHGGFGGSYNLCQAVNQHSQKYTACLISYEEAPYGFGNGYLMERDFDIVDCVFNEIDKYFICDYQGLMTIAKYLSLKHHREVTHEFHGGAKLSFLLDWLKEKKVIFFWSGTKYMNNSKIINGWLEKLNCRRTFSMPDLKRFDRQAIPLYQPFNLDASNKKYEKFTLCHSPGYKIVYKHGRFGKGTAKIESVFVRFRNKYQIDYKILAGIPYEDAIAAKSKSHVFVDQLMPKIGGIGKSGLEAIKLGVPTIGDIRNCDFGEYYKGCPVIHVTNKKELFYEIEKLYINANHYFEVKERCLLWGNRIDFKNTAIYLDSMITW